MMDARLMESDGKIRAPSGDYYLNAPIGSLLNLVDGNA